MRRATAALVCTAALVLTGCQSPSSPTATQGTPDSAPASGAYLQAGTAIFDPVADDVAGTEACDGAAGRDTLETFDRAPWPDLQISGGEGILTCGNADGAGWRHIADGHTGDYQELADLVDSSWEDVAWFAIDNALEQPTRVEEYRDDIVNYDILVEYVNESGEVERSWMVTVGFGLGSNQIITSFPDEQF